MPVTVPLLRALAAAAGPGTFTDAARAPGVSRSSVSRTIRARKDAGGAPVAALNGR